MTKRLSIATVVVLVATLATTAAANPMVGWIIPLKSVRARRE